MNSLKITRKLALRTFLAATTMTQTNSQITQPNFERPGQRYFYIDTYEGSFRRRWELFDVQKSEWPNFVMARRKADGKIVSVRISKLEIESV